MWFRKKRTIKRQEPKNIGDALANAYRRGYHQGWHNANQHIQRLIFDEGLSPIKAFRVMVDLFHQVMIWAIREKGDLQKGPSFEKVRSPYQIQEPSPGFIYFLSADNGLYKIGMTQNLDHRIKQLGIKLPYELRLIHAIGTDERHFVEKHFHSKFSHKCIRGEWFDLTDEDLAEIKEIDYILTCGISRGAE